MFVRNYMTMHPIAVTPQTLVRDAARLLADKGIHQLPVLDENDQLVGIVTDRDIRSATGYDPSNKLTLTVEEILIRDPVKVSPDTTLEEALAILHRHTFSSLPVMANQKLVGIVTRYDLMRAFLVILGMDQPGTRVEVALTEGISDLVAAFQALESLDIFPISAVLGPIRGDYPSSVLYLRINSNNPGPVHKALRDAGLVVLSPETASEAGAPEST